VEGLVQIQRENRRRSVALRKHAVSGHKIAFFKLLAKTKKIFANNIDHGFYSF
jgi:hypothetical protein